MVCANNSTYLCVYMYLHVMIPHPPKSVLAGTLHLCTVCWQLWCVCVCMVIFVLSVCFVLLFAVILCFCFKIVVSLVSVFLVWLAITQMTVNVSLFQCKHTLPSTCFHCC